MKSENTTIHGFVGWLVVTLLVVVGVLEFSQLGWVCWWLLVVGYYAVGGWWLVVVSCWGFRVKPTWDFFEKTFLISFWENFLEVKFSQKRGGFNHGIFC